MRPSRQARLITAFSVWSIWTYPAQALPFHRTGSSFATYLNSINWDNGKNYHFFRLYACKYNTSEEKIPDNQLIFERQQQVKGIQRQKEVLLNARGFLWDEMENAYHHEKNEDKAARLSNSIDEYDQRIDRLEKEIREIERRDTPVRQILTYEHFSCSGYARVSDPRGSWVCEMEARYNGETSRTSFETSGCVWK